MHSVVSSHAHIPKPRDLPPLAWLAVTLAFAPIPIKRLALTGEPDLMTWFAWDYSLRCVMLLGVALAYRAQLVPASYRRAGWQTSANVFALALALQLIENALIFPALSTHLHYFRTFTHPAIRDPLVFAADLFAGMLLVAASEELVFRRLAFALLERWGAGAALTVLASSTVFALIHLTSGLDNTVNAFVMGLILGATFHLTRRIGIAIALHYIDDVLVFGGVV